MTDTATHPPSALGLAWAGTRRFRPVLALDVVMLVVFPFLEPVFLTRANIFNLLTAVSIVWVVALGMTFVLLSGGFDLSAGAVATLAGIALATALEHGVSGWWAIGAAVVAGGLLGAVNGLLVGRLRLSVFVVTLASMTAFTGLAALITDSQTLVVANPALDNLVIDRIAGVPTLVWVMALTFLLALFLQTRTHFGRDVYAVGGSSVAAELAGIRSARTVTVVYVGLGLCAGLGGVIAAGRIGGAAPQVDGTLPLSAIAAVLIGGTSLAGGIGGVGGTMFGVLFVGILANGLSLSGVPTFWQQVITGVILVAAVLGDRLSLRGRRRWRRRTPPSPPMAVGRAPLTSSTPPLPSQVVEGAAP